MGVIYAMSEDSVQVRELVTQKAAELKTTLTIVHQPLGLGDKPSPWPYGVTDGKAIGWFENDMLLFWGAPDYRDLLKELRRLGVDTYYAG